MERAFCDRWMRENVTVSSLFLSMNFFFLFAGFGILPQTASYSLWISKIVITLLGVIVFAWNMVQEYCKRYYKNSIMGITMALFPTIFAIMETALVEYKLSEAEKKKEQGLRQLLWETFGLK